MAHLGVGLPHDLCPVELAVAGRRTQISNSVGGCCFRVCWDRGTLFSSTTVRGSIPTVFSANWASKPVAK